MCDVSFVKIFLEIHQLLLGNLILDIIVVQSFVETYC